jgi:hypothetical protein
VHLKNTIVYTIVVATAFIETKLGCFDFLFAILKHSMVLSALTGVDNLKTTVE